jgi:hypothetical protein
MTTLVLVLFLVDVIPLSQQKEARFNTWCQFHQHFLHAFLVQKFVQSQTQSSEKTFVRKTCAKNVDEIDSWMNLCNDHSNQTHV